MNRGYSPPKGIFWLSVWLGRFDTGFHYMLRYAIASCPMCNFVGICYRTEIKQGAEVLAEKIKKYRPKIAAFNGKGNFNLFCRYITIFCSDWNFLKFSSRSTVKILCKHFVFRQVKFGAVAVLIWTYDFMIIQMFPNAVLQIITSCILNF